MPCILSLAFTCSRLDASQWGWETLTPVSGVAACVLAKLAHTANVTAARAGKEPRRRLHCAFEAPGASG